MLNAHREAAMNHVLLYIVISVSIVYGSLIWLGKWRKRRIGDTWIVDPETGKRVQKHGSDHHGHHHGGGHHGDGGHGGFWGDGGHGGGWGDGGGGGGHH
jgi:hypothetical protein